MRAMRIKMTICFPMLDGETKDQAVDRLIERIDSDEKAIMSWNESEVEICDYEEYRRYARMMIDEWQREQEAR